jgi:putative MATE family efflux protein
MKKKRIDTLLEMSVSRAIFSLAWPTIFAVLLQNLATTVDMIMVGRLGAAEIAAVGFSSMIYWLLSSLIIGIEASVTAVVARAIGAGRPEEASRGLGQAYILGVTTSIIMAVATFALAPDILNLFGVEPDVYELSVPYLRLLCVGQVFFTIASISSGALRGAGDVRTPMFIGGVVNIIHIILNYMLILGKFGFPSYGVKGAAYGTLISYAAGALIFLILISKKRVGVSISRSDFRLDLNRLWQIARVALPAGAEMIVLQVGLLIYAKFIVDYGTIALSGYQVGMQVLSLSFIPNTGFGTAASTLIGQNLGAGRKQAAKKTGWICMFWGMVSMGLLGVLYFMFTRQIASIFVNDRDVIDVAVSFIRAVALCQGGMAIYFTLSGALRGAGDTRSPLVITLLGMYGFRIPAAFMVTRVWEMGVGVAFSLLIFDYLVRDVAILIRYARGRWVDTRL